MVMITFLSLLLPVFLMLVTSSKPVKKKKSYKVYNVVLLDQSGNPITRYTYLK